MGHEVKDHVWGGQAERQDQGVRKPRQAIVSGGPPACYQLEPPIFFLPRHLWDVTWVQLVGGEAVSGRAEGQEGSSLAMSLPG